MFIDVSEKGSAAIFEICLLLAGYLLGLLVNPEDGGSAFLRNVD
jgi:hypothetical protein